jgi:hypothetical protein
MKKVFRRPSPAMVVAIVALIAALGGTAVAGGALNKKKVKNISNNQITQRAPGLSVKSADNATTATRAQGPVGWAHVNTAGTVLAGNNVTTGNVTKATFYYCFQGLSFPVNDAVASPDYWNGSPQFDTVLQVGFAARGGLGGTGCPAGTQVFVHGVQADNDGPSVVAFHILFLN